MCGRFSLRLDPAALEAEIEAPVPPEYEPTFNHAPQQLTLILEADEKKTKSLRTRQLSWGWLATVGPDQKFVINARSETVREKRLFAEAFRQRRCLVPATGFYEWDRRDRGGPWNFQPQDASLFAFAAFWKPEAWQHAPGFVMLTTEASPVMAPVHHRQPVIIPRSAWSDWLGARLSPAEEAALLRPLPFSDWSSWRVSPEVNKVIHNHAGLLEPWTPPQEQLDLFEDTP